MQLSSVSNAYGGGEAQRLLARLFGQQGPPAGQDLPGDSAAPDTGATTLPMPPGGGPSAGQFAQYQVVLRLAPALKEIFASDTSDFAKLFADYLTPPASLRGSPWCRCAARPSSTSSWAATGPRHC